MKTLIALLISTAAFAQTTVNTPALTVSAEATTAINTWLRGQVGTTNATTLSTTIDASTTTVVIEDGSLFTGSSVIKIDDEVMITTNKVGKALTVTRGAFGSVAASHTGKVGQVLGAGVSVMKYKDFKDLFVSDIKALVSNILEQSPTATQVTQDAVIATAKAAKDAAKTGAVQ